MSSTTVELNSHTMSSLDDLRSMSPIYQSSTIHLLIKILQTIIDQPEEKKYRRINAVKLAPKLRTKAGLVLLESLGFQHPLPAVIETNPSEADFMTIEEEPKGKQLETIKLVAQKLKDILEEADKRRVTITASSTSSSSSTSSAASTLSSSSTRSTNPLVTPIPSPLPFPVQEVEKGDVVEDDKFVFFWHAPSPFAQWTMVPFTIDGLVFQNAEQWMMGSKAKLFHDHTVFAKIMTTAVPREHKKLGRKVANFDEAVWKKHALDIVIKGNYAKFSQHPSYRQRLLATGNKTLVEASPLDAIWGIGLASDHPDARNPSKWQGSNLLGQALMKVREIMREEEAQDGVFH